MACPLASAQVASFNLINPATGGTATSVYGLSANGGIAAGYTFSSDGPQPGFTWTAPGGRHDFGLDAGLPSVTLSAAISGDGSTVTGTSWNNPNSARAFRYRPGDGPTTFDEIGVFPGYAVSRGEGISGDGSVVVGRCLQSATSELIGRAFRWTSSTGLQDLGVTRPGNIYGDAAAISRDGGTIVGSSQDSLGFRDAFAWTLDTGMVALPPLPGTTSAFAWGVNFNGSIIVGQSGAATTGTLWLNHVPIDLGTPAGMLSVARAVSDDGSIVVGHVTGGAATGAYVWTTGRGGESLANYLAFNGVGIPAGWTPVDCFAVSGDGLSIGGRAIGPDGVRGFVAMVPEPGTVSVLLLLAGGARRQRPPAG